jgi:hypothetical protein
MTDFIYTARTGKLVYYDSVSGLLTARITKVNYNPIHGYYFELVITSKIRNGEVVETSSRFVIPRDRIKRSRFGTKILPFKWSKK